MICVSVHLSQTAVKLDGFVSVALMQMEKNEGIYKDNPERNVFFSPVLSHTREKLIERKSPDNKSVCFLSTGLSLRSRTLLVWIPVTLLRKMIILTLKAPEQPLNEPGDEIVSSAAV